MAQMPHHLIGIIHGVAPTPREIVKEIGLPAVNGQLPQSVQFNVIDPRSCVDKTYASIIPLRLFDSLIFMHFPSNAPMESLPSNAICAGICKNSSAFRTIPGF
jgi:hypothetical protein